MIRKILPIVPTPDNHADYSPSMGIHLRTGLRAGDWRCTACQGQAIGSNLIKPKCDYCELT